MSNTAPTTKAEAIAEAKQTIDRAGWVFINPPAQAMQICHKPLISAGKAVKELARKPGDQIRHLRACNAIDRIGRKFYQLAQIHREAGKIEDAMELTSLGHTLHDVGNKLLRTFSQP